jgi:hypothetical protein
MEGPSRLIPAGLADVDQHVGCALTLEHPHAQQGALEDSLFSSINWMNDNSMSVIARRVHTIAVMKAKALELRCEKVTRDTSSAWPVQALDCRLHTPLLRYITMSCGIADTGIAVAGESGLPIVGPSSESKFFDSRSSQLI